MRKLKVHYENKGNSTTKNMKNFLATNKVDINTVANQANYIIKSLYDVISVGLKDISATIYGISEENLHYVIMAEGMAIDDIGTKYMYRIFYPYEESVSDISMDSIVSELYKLKLVPIKKNEIGGK